MSPDTKLLLRVLTYYDSFTRYEVYCVVRALLDRARGVEDEGAAMRRMALEIVADYDGTLERFAATRDPDDTWLEARDAMTETRTSEEDVA